MFYIRVRMCVKLILSWTFRKTAVTSPIIYKGTLHVMEFAGERKRKRNARIEKDMDRIEQWFVIGAISLSPPLDSIM